MLLENYRNIFRRNCYKVLHAVTGCYKIVSLYISHNNDTSPQTFRFFVSLHGPSRPYKPLQQMYTLKYSQKLFFPRIKEKSSQNLRLRRNSCAAALLARLIHSPAVMRGMDGMDGNGHVLATKLVLSCTMSHYVT